MSPTFVEVLEFFRFASTIITPIALFWLGVVVTNRRNAVDNLDKKLNDLRKDITDGRTECREDIQAMIQQMAEYPRRSELSTAISDVREDIRAAYGRRPQR